MRHYSKGMTLVELMVALAIGLVITLAAVSSLIVARRGFSTVDAASQLRDNSRFAADLVQRVAFQAGFKDPTYVITPPTPKDIQDDASGLISSSITGFNNATLNTSTLITANSRTTSDGSDILILRYQTAKKNNDSSSTSDKTMIDCAGNTVTTIPIDRNDRVVSVFYIATGADGEPSLMCARSATGMAPFSPRPIVRGVENFQVLYGIDGANAVNLPVTPFTGSTDSVPEKYLRADQIIVGGVMNSQATYNNWRRVRSIRIGMVLRGPANSQQERASQTFYPFGQAKDSSTGSLGSALSSTSDIGTVYTPPVDGRLRQVVTFTIHLRNDQGL